MFQISMFLEYTYHTTSMPSNSKKCPWHTDVKLTKEAKKISKGWIEMTFRQT